jgi:hypothetical protein
MHYAVTVNGFITRVFLNVSSYNGATTKVERERER